MRFGAANLPRDGEVDGSVNPGDVE